MTRGKVEPESVRFWRYVDTNNGPDACWLWLGTRDQKGYGKFTIDGGRRESAHRTSWRLAGHQLDRELTIDHLCRNTSCVNPAHLEQVTMRENLLRGNNFASNYAKRTHCSHGHEYTPENIMWLRTKHYPPWRKCRECERIRHQRLWRAAHPLSESAPPVAPLGEE